MRLTYGFHHLILKMVLHFLFFIQHHRHVFLFAFVIAKTAIVTFIIMLPNIDFAIIEQPSFKLDRFIVTKVASKPSFISIK